MKHLGKIVAFFHDGRSNSIEFDRKRYVTSVRSAQQEGAAMRTDEVSVPIEVPAAPAIDPIHDFYCRPRSMSAVSRLRSRYEIWEAGEAYFDSVTPSTYCARYREHMVRKIASLSIPNGNVFSIGCGNAFIEGDLVARGLRVQAIDCNSEAVVLAATKGVDSFTADYYTLPAGHLAMFDAVYADGLLGHLYRTDRGLDRFFETLDALMPCRGTWIVLSNDAPGRPDLAVAPNDSVQGFWLLSKDYLARMLTRFGFEVLECYDFPYLRPISGLRNRAICIARTASREPSGC
jgi:2-polyprenyl-3-methyl-5-hydroxy-6-metoxy-1,4-benzoquinol methylase